MKLSISMNTLRRPSIWIIIALFIIITFLQYAESLQHPYFLAHLTESLGLTRYTVERLLYLFPIIWAGIIFGWKGGAVVSLFAVASMLPRAILISPSPEDAVVETFVVFIVGNLAAFSFSSLKKERDRRAQLEAAQRELQSQLQVIEQNEKRLAALNLTSAIISQSLELEEVLDSAVNCVIDVMGVEIVRIYLIDKDAGVLTLLACRGISSEFANDISQIKIGEGFNGRVAKTGKPLYVVDASEDPSLPRIAAREENIRSQLIVPLISKGNVVGTICVAVRTHRQFLPDEVDLITAIGNQIGVAIENAHLYRQERQFAEQLRQSEQRYRGLFENAHDAIWLNDLEGNIVAANRSCVQLTGYDLDELYRLKNAELISEESLETTKAIEQRLIDGEVLGSLGEVKLIRKDGTEALVQLAGSLVSGNGHSTAFQYVARDVTDEKRMQENLRFYLQQITRAQEEERRRIAQELHDDTVQALVFHSLQIDELGSKVGTMPRGDIQSRLKELRHEVNRTMDEVRRLSRDLRPAALDRLGLLPALEWLASSVNEYAGVATKVKVVGTERRLPDEIELVLFRIAQEALRNVWKHAQATKADITMAFKDDKIIITIHDNGTGFAIPGSVADLPRYGKLGLAGMQERARLLGGTLTIKSKEGKGTTVTAEIMV